VDRESDALKWPLPIQVSGAHHKRICTSAFDRDHKLDLPGGSSQKLWYPVDDTPHTMVVSKVEDIQKGRG